MSFCYSNQLDLKSAGLPFLTIRKEKPTVGATATAGDVAPDGGVSVRYTRRDGKSQKGSASRKPASKRPVSRWIVLFCFISFSGCRIHKALRKNLHSGDKRQVWMHLVLPPCFEASAIWYTVTHLTSLSLLYFAPVWPSRRPGRALNHDAHAMGRVLIFFLQRNDVLLSRGVLKQTVCGPAEKARGGEKEAWLLVRDARPFFYRRSFVT